MIGKKTLLLAIAVVAVGLFILPQTMALFAGQHTFYNGSSVRCDKCHTVEASELSAGNAHETMECRDCHGYGGTYSQYNTFDNSTQHAAISPNCTDCHGANASTMAGLGNVSTEIQDAQESHREFYLDSINQSVLEGGNEACVACHTHTGVNITWKRASTMNITANHTTSRWVIETINATGHNTTYSYNTSYGY